MSAVLKSLPAAKIVAACAMVAVSLFMLFMIPIAQADTASDKSNGAQVIQEFDQQQVNRVESGKLTSHRKHVIIFMLGVPLVILVLITGGLGIAMGVYGKQKLFVPHLLSAGLTITLALVHAIVSMIWFFPF